jgi:GNAT superfamily N-acetyltransferase
MLAKTDGVIFAVERFDDVYDEARELLDMHWSEVAPYKDMLTLNPNVEAYKKAEAQGLIVIITARMDFELIGYIVMIIHPHMHYQHVLTATDDIHFLHPDHRKGTTGWRLLRAAENEMRARGVRLMTLRTKVEHDHGKIFEHLGFHAQDVVYTKRLDGAFNGH